MNPQTLEQVNQIVAAIQQHPLWAHIGLISLLIAGVLLWVSGRKVLKPIFAVLGALSGGFLGHAIVPGIGIDNMFGVSGDLAGAAVGGAVGALAALLVFRVAVGVLAALVVSGLAILGASVFIQSTEPPQQLPIQDESESALVAPGLEDTQESWKPQLEDVPEAINEPGKFVSDIFFGAKAQLWDPLKGADKALLTASGLAGLVAGLALGVLAPKKSTALVTAFSGSGMWLPALYFLSQVRNIPGKAMLEREPIEWLVIWLVVSLTGLFIQWQGLADRKKSKRSKRDDDDDDDDDSDEEEQ